MIGLLDREPVRARPDADARGDQPPADGRGGRAGAAGGATARTVVLRRLGASTPVTAGAAAVARRPGVAFATGGLGLATAGIMVLMALSSIQAFLMISQQSSTNTRNQLSLAADLDPATAGDAALALAAEGIGALTGDDPSGPAVAAGQLGGDTTGHPTAPVTRDQTVVVHGIRVHRSIAEDVRDLIDAAAADGITLAGWGWRDHQTQIRLRREHCGTTEYAIYRMPSSQCSPPTARPGRSQHERGLAIDFTYNGGSISSRSNTGFRWLAANAATYGLQNLASEPWHWSTTGR